MKISQNSAAPEFFPHLFESGRIRNLRLANRLIMAPMESNLANADGTVSPEMLEYYRVRAAGGVGMVIVEYTCVDRPQGIGGSPQLGIDDDRFISSHRSLADAIHQSGAAACLQLFHAGRQTHPKFIDGLQPIAASAIPCPMYRKMPRAMDQDDILHVIRKFGEATERAAKAGYDAVELHGAHGYLIGNFLSAASNHREDEYGGPLENRLRFARMIVREVRRCAGDMPVIFRISADEFVEHGTNIEEAKDIACKITEDGVDAIHVSTGCHERLDRNVDPVWLPEGWRIPLARAIRKHVNIPVITVGVIRHAEVAERAIEDGSADFVALARAILADPQWPNKVRTGRLDDIRPCTSCNWCIAQIGKGDSPIGCAENPRAGHETEAFPVYVGQSLKTVVVGSGPAGIAAALTLEQCGFRVTMLERTDIIAPGLLASGAAPKKEKFLWYRNYLLRRLENANVDLRLGTEATADAICAFNPAFVVLATGSLDRELDVVETLDAPHVTSAYQILTGEKQLGVGPIVIYGAGEIGCETAKFAADKGYDVILATRSSDENALARANKMRIYREQFVKNLKEIQNVRIELGCTLKSVHDGKVEMSRNNEALFWDAGQVLLAVGRLPNAALAKELKARGRKTYVVGDSHEVQRIGDAVHHAYQVIRTITLEHAPNGQPQTELAF